MKNQLSLIAAAALLTFGASTAMAQPATGAMSNSGAASTAKGEKSTKDQDKGLNANVKSLPSESSGTPAVRADVKSEAAMANKSGTGTAKGQKSTKDQDKGMAANTKTSPTGGGGTSTADRSTVSSDAATANKSGTGTAKGEKSTKDQDKGGAKQ